MRESTWSRRISERLEVADDAVGVLGKQAAQEARDPLARASVEMAEHPVIERRDDSALENPEIAGMRDRRGRIRIRRSA